MVNVPYYTVSQLTFESRKWLKYSHVNSLQILLYVYAIVWKMLKQLCIFITLTKSSRCYLMYIQLVGNFCMPFWNERTQLRIFITLTKYSPIYLFIELGNITRKLNFLSNRPITIFTDDCFWIMYVFYTVMFCHGSCANYISYHIRCCDVLSDVCISVIWDATT